MMVSNGMYIADRYEILDKIGAGGMSDVYKAKDHMLGRAVAVKILKPEFSEDRNFVTKFRTEAQSAAGLEHPNIVNIYDVGSENGMHFIVMEYVEGITLKTYIEKKGQLSFKETVSISIQVARGIEIAHSKHIIHRDIKPQNIIISTEGKVKVTDFGIARAASANTISADVMGSVHYASPEQARNGFVDGRSDIYSLGIVMYEMVTGRVPFDGDTTVAVAIQHLQEEMPSPSEYARDLPISMEKIILKCTLKNPDRRYQTITELLTDLRQSLATPDEDFVVMVSADDNTKTKILSASLEKQIREAEEREESETEDYDGEEEETDDYDEEYEDEEEYEEDDDGIGLNPKLARIVTIGGIVVAVLLVIVIIYMISSLIKSFKNTGTGPSQTPLPSVSESLPPSQTGTQPTETDSSGTESESMSESESQTDAEKVKVPDLVNGSYNTYDTAKAMLEEVLGLKIKIRKEVDSKDHEPGQIIKQYIDAGIMVDPGTEVEVDVAKMEAEYITIMMPNLVEKADGSRMTEAEALKVLEENYLIPEKAYEPSDTLPYGYVISQETPANTSIKTYKEAAKRTRVKITISTGKKTLDMPNVVGQDEATAIAEIEKAGYVSDVQRESSNSVAEGKVIRQTQEAGKVYKVGTVVGIVVSTGKQVEYYNFAYNLNVPAGAAGVFYELKDKNGNVIQSEGSAAAPKPATPGTPVPIVKANLKNISEGTLYYVWYSAETVTEPDPVSGGEVTKTTWTEMSRGSENALDQYFVKQ